MTIMTKPIRFRFTKNAEKFLIKNTHRCNREDIEALIIKAIGKMYGVKESVDIKRLQGLKPAKFRVRQGEIRIIFSFEEDEIIITALIEEINRRGNISYA